MNSIYWLISKYPLEKALWRYPKSSVLLLYTHCEGQDFLDYPTITFSLFFLLPSLYLLYHVIHLSFRNFIKVCTNLFTSLFSLPLTIFPSSTDQIPTFMPVCFVSWPTCVNEGHLCGCRFERVCCSLAVS